MDNEISEEEAKHDLKEFRKLQKYVNAVYKEDSWNLEYAKNFVKLLNPNHYGTLQTN